MIVVSASRRLRPTSSATIAPLVMPMRGAPARAHASLLAATKVCMPTKTPLLGALRSFFRDAQIAKAHGVPVDALREVRAIHAERARRRGVSRRTFLTTAGAAAAASVVPRVSLAARAPTVVIVGGGIAGLNCALELADVRDQEHECTEASGGIGGRMFSNNSYWDAGQVTEWCGELIDTSHTTVRKLAKRFDLRLDNLLGAQPPQSDDIYHFSGQDLAKSQADRDFCAVADIIAGDAEAAGFPTTFDSNTAAGRALDRLSVYDYIERRIPGGHRSPLGALLDVAYVIRSRRRLSGAVSTDDLIFLLGFQPNQKTLCSIFGRVRTRSSTSAAAISSCPQAIAADLGPGAVHGSATGLTRSRADRERPLPS